MTDKGKKHVLIPSEGSMFANLALRLKLTGRLMLDPRVPALLKLLPIGSLVYLLVPDLLIGPIDDAAIVWGALYFFVELAPPHVVEEHVRELSSVMESDWEVVQDDDPADDEPRYIDGSFTDTQ